MNISKQWAFVLGVGGGVLLFLAAWLLLAPMRPQEVAVLPTAVSPTATLLPSPTPSPSPTTTRPPARVTYSTRSPAKSVVPPPTPPEPTTPPTATPPPSPEPTLEPTPTPSTTALIGPPWLLYLNRFRAMALVPPVSADERLSTGSLWHSRYMVKNDNAIAHAEDPSNPYYDADGHRAAQNGNIFATSQLDADYIWGINFWVSAPFHLVPMIDPRLAVVGFGSYSEVGGSVQMAAVLDVGSGPLRTQPDASYPLVFPAEGSNVWVVRNSMYEWPDPLQSCPGYSRPVGAPIVLQLGDGKVTPQVSSHVLRLGDIALESCLFDETSYRNSDAYAQGVGRRILDRRDAIVIIPRYPLGVGQRYTVQVVANGQTYTWQFTTFRSAEEAAAVE